MRRIIIVSLGINYPRGDAKANYVQYFADALKAEDYPVELVLSTNQDYSKQKEFEYHGTHVRSLMACTGISLFDRLLNGKLFWLRLSHILKGYGLTSSDVVVSEPFLDPCIRKLQKKYHFKTASWIHEWYGREQYESDALAAEGDRLFADNGKKNLIFPISHYIADQFKDSDCQTLILPIMADTREIPYKEKTYDGKYQFIFPANGRMKDSLSEILHGLASMSQENLDRMTFHLTGVKEAVVREILSPTELERIEDVLVIHKWMQYEELVSLYQQVHFLFFSRPVSQTTMSNFPSKVPEALTYGVVPVVSRVGDYTKYYLSDGEDSLIFDGDSSEVCRAAMERALQIPFPAYQKMSAAARNTAETRFDYRNWQKKIRDSIENLFAC